MEYSKANQSYEPRRDKNVSLGFPVQIRQLTCYVHVHLATETNSSLFNPDWEQSVQRKTKPLIQFSHDAVGELEKRLGYLSALQSKIEFQLACDVGLHCLHLSRAFTVCNAPLNGPLGLKVLRGLHK